MSCVSCVRDGYQLVLLLRSPHLRNVPLIRFYHPRLPAHPPHLPQRMQLRAEKKLFLDEMVNRGTFIEERVCFCSEPAEPVPVPRPLHRRGA